MTAGAIDLHLHSTASDGRLEPRALVRHVHDCGVAVMALTDHDSTAGLDDAASEAAALGMTFVPGIEISTEWRGRSIHVLGLAIDPSAPGLVAALEGLHAERQRRAEEIARRLDAAGAPGAEALQRVLAVAALPTRTHFARALADLGAVHSLAEAFDRFLGRGRPAAVRSRWPAVAEAVGRIRESGGVAVLAHPLRYVLSGGARRELCREFREAGGAGIEVVCGGSSRAQVAQAESLALRSGLAGSVGSDFHDPRIPWNPPGRLAKLPRAVPALWSIPAFPIALPDVA